MTLKKLFDQAVWEEIWAAFSIFFPDYVGHETSYRNAFNEIRSIKPRSGHSRLFIGRFEPQAIIPFYLLGFEGDCPKGFCLKFSHWEDWLGIDVNELVLSQFERADIVAICLFDMTWSGFSLEDVIAFKKGFIKNKHWIKAVLLLVEDVKASEPNLVKKKQRAEEVFEAIGLKDVYDIDKLYFVKQSPEYHKAFADLEVQIYCLGESETDYEAYCSKVSALREIFHLKWPDPTYTHPVEH